MVNSNNFVNIAYSQGFIPLLQTESFPEKIQSTGAGMIEGTSQIGSFLAPYVVSIVTNSGQKPIVFISIIVIILGIFPLKFIKETFIPSHKNKDETETNDNVFENLINEDK